MSREKQQEKPPQGPLGRPEFPKRAVITGGMPYGNKSLHFGHVGGVFVQADVFARFLRDRIGPENVIFVSGTDCYGSPIVEYHRNALASGEFDGSLQAFVEHNHQRQKDVLDAYHVHLDLFAASGLEPYCALHEELGARILKTLRNHGLLVQRRTLQFYDTEHDTFLNGRQVTGKCPVNGCSADAAYADECSLGHQYEPKELIDPVSTLSGGTPEMREVTNWYVDLPAMRETIEGWVKSLREQPGCRPFVVSNMLEYFEPPIIHITKDQVEAVDELAAQLPSHERAEGRGKSLQLIFEDLSVMEEARVLLASNGVRYRTGKTLVPFRLTGNLEWGLPAPDLEGLEGLTFWVWPESLWAPISFVQAYLRAQGASEAAWEDWWCSPEARVYQFIGEDNIFFYGVAQAGIWLGMQGESPTVPEPEGNLQLTEMIANRHLMFLNRKASSSGKVKPPMAEDLLDYYTPDQLRAHFFSLGLGMRSIGFAPKPLNPKAGEKDGDPVLKEGNLLSNTFNRAARSCFYTAQKFYDATIPQGEVSETARETSRQAVLDFERHMYEHNFQMAVVVAGDFIRHINQVWNQAKPFADDCDEGVRKQALIDSFHMVKTASTLMHPIAPEGTECIRDYLNVGEDLWSWERIFEPLTALMADPATHRLKELPPRTDFFRKHPYQVRAMASG